MKNTLTKIKGMMARTAIAATVAVNYVVASANAFLAAETDSASANPFEGVVSPIVDLINSLFAPMMAIVVAVGSLYCIILGVKFAKAEEPQEHEKAKTHLKNAIIGFVLIFVLVVALKLSVGPLTAWMAGAGQ